MRRARIDALDKRIQIQTITANGFNDQFSTTRPGGHEQIQAQAHGQGEPATVEKFDDAAGKQKDINTQEKQRCAKGPGGGIFQASRTTKKVMLVVMTMVNVTAMP
jgi:hypothetical protein